MPLFNIFQKKPKPKQPLLPVLCQGPGRTGSTLLMELMLTSPKVLPEPMFPHENRMLAALACSAMAFWRVPEEMPNEHRQLIQSMTDGMQIRPQWPWRSDEISRAAEEPLLWQEFLRVQWQMLSDRLSVRRPEATLYAEKSGETLSWILKKAKVPHKILLRTRDPRDHWCSLHSFNEKRGHELEGSNVPLRTVEERLPLFIDRLKNHYAMVIDTPIPKNMKIVRYEDMVSQLDVVAKEISEWLGIELTPKLALERSGAHPEHRTAKSPDASIGRWKSDLDPGIRTVIEKELQPLFDKFGYAV